MNPHHLCRTARRRGNFVPRLETLEGRALLACTFNTPNFTIPPGGNLVITGDGANDNVQIQDAGNFTLFGVTNWVAVSCAGQPLQTFAGVTSITMNAGGGDDVITYLPHPLLPPGGFFQGKAVTLDLGDGNDTFNANLTIPLGTAATAGNSLQFNVQGGIGTDAVNATIGGNLEAASSNLGFVVDLGGGADTFTAVGAGNLNGTNSSLRFDVKGGTGVDADTATFVLNGNLAGASSRMDFVADLGQGNDMLVAVLAGNLTGVGARLQMFANGGADRDVFSINLTGNVAASATVGFDLFGGNVKLKKQKDIDNDRDTLSVRYNGQLRGQLSVNANGGVGRDRIWLDITNAVNEGMISAEVKGSAGDDRMRLSILPNELTNLDVQADGGPGSDICRYTDNIDEHDIRRCEILDVI